MNRWSPFRLVLAGLLSLGLAHAASAQPYPSKPIKIIVPFAAGGANDLSARAIQQPLAKVLGGTVIVENIAGASTKLATEQLVKAPPDGYTLMLAGHLAQMGYFYSGAVEEKYWHKMTILGQTGQFPWGMLEAKADAPFKTWQELVAHAKKNPGKLNVGGPAPGGMMNMIVLETAKSAGIQVTYIPYKGGGPSGLALLGGQVDYRVAQPSEVYPNVKAGKTRFAVQPYPRPDVVPNSIGVPIGFDERARVLASRPDVYYVTDHFLKYPGVLVRLASVDRKELREILSAAWQYAMEHQVPAARPRRKAGARAARARR